MKRILTTIIALLALTGAGNAQVSGLNVGYCQGVEGQFPSTSDSYFADLSVQKDSWTSGAILLKTEKLRQLAGNQIREIHAALTSKLNVDSLQVWVSRTLDGPAMQCDTVTDMVKLWNTVPLSRPVDITADMESLYIGYSYHQKSTCKALSCLEKTTAPGYACFVRKGQEDWKDCSDSYTLCVEAMVYGDNLPRYDLTLQALAVQKNFVVDNGTLEIKATVLGSGMATVTGFDAVCSISGIDETYTAHCDTVVAYGETKEAVFTIRPTAIQTMDPAEREITVTLAGLNEGEDGNPSDNTLTGSFSVTLHSFVRQVLLEEFTTEKCVNCPRMAQFVHAALEEPEFEGRLNLMENHVGYYTDSFTASFHRDWEWFFDNMFAPAVMFDRHADEGQVSAIHSVATQNDFFELVRQRLRETAFVSLKIEADVDTVGQKIFVTVTGSRAKEDITTHAPRITVVLTETNLKAISQAGIGSDTEYYHYHVGRRVNSSWGDVLEWDGDDYRYECVIPYTRNYVMENLGLLAFVHDYDPEDKTRCEVANSAAISSQDFTHNMTGVQPVAIQPADESVCWFDLQGRALEQPAKGVCIEVRGGKARKLLVR
ncbi:MAG: Omp28-related outer membrane protein [Alloprevotella sp.]